jgi:hypothetical protein
MGEGFGLPDVENKNTNRDGGDARGVRLGQRLSSAAVKGNKGCQDGLSGVGVEYPEMNSEDAQSRKHRIGSEE